VTEEAEVVIVGGGPVGAALALALTGAGYPPVLLEPRAADDGAEPLRPVALSHGSRHILERLDAWSQVAPATPIARIHISQRSGFGRAVLTARDVGLRALGYVVDYRSLRAALGERLARRPEIRIVRAPVARVVPGHDRASIEFPSGEETARITARLVVIADGGAIEGDAPSRVVDYRQSAVVAMVSSEKPHGNTAFERFTPTGPLALLPCETRYALVWSVKPERAQQLCRVAGVEFARELQDEFGDRLGAFSGIEQRAAYPLALKVTTDSLTPRVLRVGNAAQMLHPVAGQGLNLGLRDAWELAAQVVRIAGHDVGSSATCAAFRARRRLDRAGTIGFTDALVRGFSNDLAPLRAARGIALTALGCVPPARDFVVRRMTFGARA
jgi:2-octaprenyl-6-methoxyphenol hydroxylase